MKSSKKQVVWECWKVIWNMMKRNEKNWSFLTEINARVIFLVGLFGSSGWVHDLFQGLNAARFGPLVEGGCRVGCNGPGRWGWKSFSIRKTIKKGGTTVDGRNPANQLRLLVFPIIYRVLYIPDVVGLLPSIIVLGYHWMICGTSHFWPFVHPMFGWKSSKWMNFRLPSSSPAFPLSQKLQGEIYIPCG